MLVLHGLTGSPKSVEPWAHALSSRDLVVSVPVLAGHSGSWRELERVTWSDWVESAQHELDRLAMVCDHVVIAGFSMGGAVGLRLAQTNPGAIAGLTLVNPSLGDHRLRTKLVPLAMKWLPAIDAAGTDVNKPGTPRHSHDVLPLRAVHQLRKLWEAVHRDIESLTLPMQFFISTQDHVVPAKFAQQVARQVPSSDVEIVTLHDSYHVAMWDFDAPLIFNASRGFIERVTCLQAPSSLGLCHTP